MRHSFRLLLLSGVLMTGPAWADADCRQMSKEVVHCFNPPPPTPLSKTDIDARQLANVRDELDVLEALRAGVTGANCHSATAIAQSKGRVDLAVQVDQLCQRKPADSPASGGR